MANFTHGDAQALLDTFRRGWEERKPGLIVDLFTDDAEYRPLPYGEPLVGANSIRAHWNEIVGAQVNVDFEPEHIWVSGSALLASWHAAYTRRATAERVRANGFMTMEVSELDDAWRVWRFRQWPLERVVGHDSSFTAEGGAE